MFYIHCRLFVQVRDKKLHLKVMLLHQIPVIYTIRLLPPFSVLLPCLAATP